LRHWGDSTASQGFEDILPELAQGSSLLVAPAAKSEFALFFEILRKFA